MREVSVVMRAIGGLKDENADGRRRRSLQRCDLCQHVVQRIALRAAHSGFRLVRDNALEKGELFRARAKRVHDDALKLRAGFDLSDARVEALHEQHDEKMKKFFGERHRDARQIFGRCGRRRWRRAVGARRACRGRRLHVERLVVVERRPSCERETIENAHEVAARIGECGNDLEIGPNSSAINASGAHL